MLGVLLCRCVKAVLITLVFDKMCAVHKSERTWLQAAVCPVQLYFQSLEGMIDQICEGLKLFGMTRLAADGFN